MVKRLVMITVLLSGLFAAMGINGCQQAVLEQDQLPTVVRRELTGDPKTMDPHLAGDVISSAQVGMAYEQLYDYDYFAQPAKVVPRLAAALPDITEGGRLYTIRLRDDVYFHDDKCFPGGKGRKMTADDVLFSIKRMAAHPETTGFWVVEGFIEGLDAYRSYAQSVMAGIDDKDQRELKRREMNDREVSGLRKVDDLTIKIRLNKPYGQLVYTMCMSYLAVIPREALEHYGTEFFRNPVGTGPFIFRHWDFGREIMWDRNPNYRKSEVFPRPVGPVKVGDRVIDPSVYDKWVGKQLPLADRIIFRVLKESQASWLEFLAGNLDVFAPESDQFSVAIQNDSLTDEMQERGTVLDKYDRGVVEYLEFNMDDPEWGSAGGAKALAVRTAVGLSFDRKEYIRTYLNGRGVPATMLVPTMFPEFTPEYTYAHSVFDPERGREVLKAAGFEVRKAGRGWECIDPATGKQVQVTMQLRGVNQTSRDMAGYLLTSGTKVGIKIECIQQEFQEFLERHNTGKGQSYNAGWVIDYPDAQNIMQMLISAQAVNYGLNSARWRNERYDELYNAFKDLSVSDPVQLQRKRELIVEAHRVLEEDCPWIVLYFARTYRLNQAWSLQAIPNDFNYTLFKYAASETKERISRASSWKSVPVLPALIAGMVMLLLAVLFFYRVVSVK